MPPNPDLDHQPSDLQNLGMVKREDLVDSDTEEVDTNGNQMRRRFRYPERPDAVDCSNQLRTGRCRFGMSCKFNPDDLVLLYD